MDARTINQTYDLLPLVESRVTLKKAGGYFVGPCPLCGGSDRFTIKNTRDGWRWHCRRCGDGKYHTAIDFVMQLDNADFKTTLQRMGGNPNAKPTQAATPTPAPLELPDETWQARAWAFVDAARDRLEAGIEGESGREYLQARGLTVGTALAWNIGYCLPFDPKAGRKRPALVLPWWESGGQTGPDNITAVKLRFIDADPEGLRYIALGGSKPLIFGLNQAIPAPALLVVEGEINALSVWQCYLRGLAVVSVGSESGGLGTRASILRALAGSYRSVWVWCDEPERAREYQKILATPGGNLIQSPHLPGGKMDANDMLRAGVLADFLTARMGLAPVGQGRRP